MILAGFWLGRSIPHIDRHVHKIILAVIVLSILPVAREIWRERQAAKSSPHETRLAALALSAVYCPVVCF